MQSDGTEIVGLGQAGFPDYLRQDLQKWKRAVELSGAKVDCQRVPEGGTSDRVHLDVLRRHHFLPAGEVLRQEAAQ